MISLLVKYLFVSNINQEALKGFYAIFGAAGLAAKKQPD